MVKLRIGIIGCGGIATGKHIPSLLKLPEVKIVALCDIVPERMEAVEQQFGLDCKRFTDYHDLCALTDVDVVHICTPNPLHCEMALEAFDHGKHVHCEKPLACTWADAQKMLSAAKKAGKKLTCGLQWRFREQNMYVRELAQRGYFGDIYYLKSQQLRQPRRMPNWGVYTSKAGNGGGIMMDGGPHSIDLPMWIAGNYDVASVRGIAMDRMKYDTEGNFTGPWDPENFDVEDTALALITMKNGAAIYVECAWMINMLQEAPGGMVVSLAGTKAGADMVGPKEITSVRLNQIVNGAMTISTPTLGLHPQPSSHDYDIFHWIDAILYDRDPAVLPEEAAVVTRVIEAFYKSAETGETVFFD